MHGCASAGCRVCMGVPSVPLQLAHPWVCAWLTCIGVPMLHWEKQHVCVRLSNAICMCMHLVGALCMYVPLGGAASMSLPLLILLSMHVCAHRRHIVHVHAKVASEAHAHAQGGDIRGPCICTGGGMGHASSTKGQKCRTMLLKQCTFGWGQPPFPAAVPALAQLRVWNGAWSAVAVLWLLVTLMT